MKLPAKDDPHGDKEGALPRSQVIETLLENDVEITELGDDAYELFDGNQTEVLILRDPIGGLQIKAFNRRYNIDLVDFYVDPITRMRRGTRH